MDKENKILEVFNDLLKLIEKVPNDQELGKLVRNEYWSKLKEIQKI